MQLQNLVPQIEGRVRVFAASTSTPAESRELVDRLGLTFPLLTDPGARVARRLGLAYEDPTFGWVPRPTSILLDEQGRVAWSSIAQSLAGRPRPREVVAAVNALVPSR